MTDKELQGCFGCLVVLLGAYLVIHNAGWGVFFGILLLNATFKWDDK